MRTPQREELFLYSEPLFTAEQHIFSRAGEVIELTDVPSMQGRRLCYPLGWQPPAAIQQLLDQGVLRPLQIAVVPFAGTHGSDISNVVSANLKRSGFFEPLNPSSFIETGLTLANAPELTEPLFLREPGAVIKLRSLETLAQGAGYKLVAYQVE